MLPTTSLGSALTPTCRNYSLENALQKISLIKLIEEIHST